MKTQYVNCTLCLSDCVFFCAVFKERACKEGKENEDEKEEEEEAKGLEKDL